MLVSGGAADFFALAVACLHVHVLVGSAEDLGRSALAVAVGVAEPAEGFVEASGSCALAFACVAVVEGDS